MAGSPPNILLIMMDSVRVDRVSCYGGMAGVTPHLDALAAAGVRFDQAISESTWTLPVALSVLTGLTPREHRGETTRKLAADIPTLPELLHAAGYQTFKATNNLWVTARSGLDRGFEAEWFPLQERRSLASVANNWLQPLGLLNTAGERLARGFQRWLRRARGPWFALLWLNDAHHPYLCSRRYAQRFQERPLARERLLSLAQRMRRPRQFAVTATAEDLRDLQGLCTGATAYVDSIVGQIVAELERQKLAEETLLIVASDHGDMLGEHGLIGHGAPSGIYQPLIRVPLIVRGPGFPAGTVSPALVQHTDVAQTIADAGGVADRLPPTAAERRNLRDAVAGRGRSAAICEREPLGPKSLARNQAEAPGFDFDRFDCHMAAVVAEDWKLITSDSEHSELYNLREDPAEAHDLTTTAPAQAAALRAQLEAFRARCEPGAAADLTPDEEEIVDKRLQDLGYL